MSGNDSAILALVQRTNDQLDSLTQEFRKLVDEVNDLKTHIDPNYSKKTRAKDTMIGTGAGATLFGFALAAWEYAKNSFIN